MRDGTLIEAMYLQDILKDGDPEYDVFSENLSRDIYAVLHPFLQDLEYVITNKWAPYFPEISMSDSERHGVQMDLEYLFEMKKLDDEISNDRRNGFVADKKVEMSAVVPISGLVHARLHILSHELETVVDIWGGRAKGVEALSLTHTHTHIT